MSRLFNARVVLDSAPIINVAVECPKCKKWFYGRDITNDRLDFEYQLDYAEFICPVCGKEFGGISPDREEVDSEEECYEGCLEKEEIWK